MTLTESELAYAGFWRRTGAYFIDGILLCLVIYPALLMTYGMSYLEDANAYWGPMQPLISYVLPAVLVLLFWIAKAATPGKMAIAATIVDARTGDKPSTTQFVIRYFSYILSTLPLFLGFVWIAFDGRKQGWHDKLAGTVVVRRKAGTAQEVRFETA